MGKEIKDAAYLIELYLIVDGFKMFYSDNYCLDQEYQKVFDQDKFDTAKLIHQEFTRGPAANFMEKNLITRLNQNWNRFNLNSPKSIPVRVDIFDECLRVLENYLDKWMEMEKHKTYADIRAANNSSLPSTSTNIPDEAKLEDKRCVSMRSLDSGYRSSVYGSVVSAPGADTLKPTGHRERTRAEKLSIIPGRYLSSSKNNKSDELLSDYIAKNISLKPKEVNFTKLVDKSNNDNNDKLLDKRR